MPAVDPERSVVAEVGGQPSSTVASRAETLKREILTLMSDVADSNVQVEASRLLSWLIEGGDALNAGDMVMVELGISALKAKSPNIRVAKYVRNQLEIRRRNHARGLVPWISRILGNSAVFAMLVGVVSSAILWILLFTAVFGGSLIWVKLFGTNTIFPQEESRALAFAAFVGGMVSVLSRVNDFANLYIFDPFLVFVNSLLKPLIGTVIALTIYAVIESEIIQVTGIKFDYEAKEGEYRHIFWAFGFIAGFSERLAGDFLARAESAVGGKQEDKAQSTGKQGG